LNGLKIPIVAGINFIRLHGSQVFGWLSLVSNIGPHPVYTQNYTLPGTVNSVTGYVGGVVPELSTWAMMLLGFAGLGFAGYRASRKSVAPAA
jgi:hypothetical protein